MTPGMWKTGLRYTVVSLVSVAVSIGVIECIYRFIEPPQQVRAVNAREEFVQYDPILGWVNKAGAEGIFETDVFKTHISINQDGMRDEPVGPKQRFRVVVLGDSLTWGWGVEAPQRYTELLEQQLDIEVINFSVIGYAPVQYYLMLDQVLSYKPDLVLLSFTLHNDFNVGTNLELETYRPYALLRGGKLEILGYPIPDYRKYSAFAHKRSKPFITNFALGRLFYFTLKKENPALFKYLFSDLEKHAPRIEGLKAYNDELVHNRPDAPAVQEAGKITGALLKLMKDKLDSQHVPFAIYGIDNRPSSYQSAPYLALLKQQAGPLGIPVVATTGLVDNARFYIRGETHWNTSGHQKAASIVEPYLKQWIAQIRANGKISPEPPADH
jgi:lysophospholipase L1-like esterase